MQKLVRAWNRLLGRNIKYDMEYPKRAEECILADITSGRLSVKRTEHSTMSHRQVDYRAVNADLWYEVDYPHYAGGSFSYLRVNGTDCMDCDPKVFDAQRVAIAMKTGTDPGPQKRNSSLYWM